SAYSGVPAVGVSAHVADNDTPGVVVTQSGGGSIVVQSSDGTYSLADHTMDQFAVVLTRSPQDASVSVNVKIAPPEGLALLTSGIDPDHQHPDQSGTPFTIVSDEVQVVTLTQASGGAFKLFYCGPANSGLESTT